MTLAAAHDLRPKPPSRLEDRFLKLWRLVSGPELEKEYRFDPTRRWRADVAHLRKNCLTEEPHCQSLKANPIPDSKNA